MTQLRPLKYIAFLFLLLLTVNAQSQVNFYRSNGGELIFSLADVTFNNNNVNSNLRFTAFFHGQQRFNLDFGKYVGLFTGVGIRNVGLITEDLYQNSGFLGVDNTHPDWNKNVKIKRRSYSVGFPLALKVGNMDKVHLFGGAEIEYMFHYKQKLFIDGDKFKFSEWASDRVNPWIPSFFAGIQLPAGMNIKFKYYLDNFLNPDFTGIDFGENVDYSTFQNTGIWYISIATIINKNSIQKMIGGNIESAKP